MAQTTSLSDRLLASAPRLADDLDKRQKAAQDILFKQGLAKKQESPAPVPAAAQAAGAQLAGQAPLTAGNQAAAQMASQGIAMDQAQQKQGLDRLALSQQGDIFDQAQAAEARSSSRDQVLRKQLSLDQLKLEKQLAEQGMEYDRNLSFLTVKQRKDLASLGRDVKQKIFDSRLAFEQDELGRKFSNDRQLADFAILSAKSDEDLQDKMQSMEQGHERAMLIMTALHKKISQELTMASEKKRFGITSAKQKELAEYKAALERKMARQRASANNRVAIGQGMMTIGSAIMVGGAATGVFAVPGLVIGGALTAAGAAVSSGAVK